MKTSPTASKELCPKLLEQSQMEQLLALVTGLVAATSCPQVMKSFSRGVDDTALLHFMP